MYIGNRHTATTTATKVLEFDCENCHNKSIAVVTGVGQGQGASPYFLDEDGAKGRAASGANKKALKNVYETIKIARCPHCNQRNKANLQNFRLMQALKLVAVFSFIFIVGLFMYNVTEDIVVMYIFTPIAIAMVPIMYFIDVHWRWSTVKNRVHFTDEKTLSDVE